jgi:hypothetical protein
MYLGIRLIRTTEINLPSTFKTYLLFLGVLLIHTLLLKGKAVYFWMFLSGGLFWLSAYNLQKSARNYFYTFLVILGFFMAGLFIYFRLTGVSSMSPDNLFLPISQAVHHNHLGDLWAIILVPTFYLLVKKFRIHQPAVITLGTVMIALSLSRSAAISLFAGLLFIADNLQKDKTVKLSKHVRKHLTTAFLIVCAGFLMYFSMSKSLLSSRPYFLEAITSFFTYPLGIGMGNFAKVSAETNVVHNLILEVVSGMGIFSGIFIYWLYMTSKDLLNKAGANIIYMAILITVFANFLFDSTYVIPGVLWIFYIALALI